MLSASGFYRFPSEWEGHTLLCRYVRYVQVLELIIFATEVYVFLSDFQVSEHLPKYADAKKRHLPKGWVLAAKYHFFTPTDRSTCAT